MPAGPASTTGPTPRSPRPSRSRAAPTSRSSCVGGALRADGRLDHRRVPRPTRPRAVRPAAGAARGGRRDRHAGRAGRRQRPAARPRMGGRAVRRDPARVGARRRRTGGDRRRPGRRPRTRAAVCRSRCRATSGRCRSPTATIRRAAARTRAATTSTARRARSGRSGSGCPTRAFELSDLRLDRTAVPTRGRRGDGRGRRHQRRRNGPATRSCSSTSVTRRRRSPGRCSSCAASGASIWRPANGGRSRSPSTRSSSPTRVPTCGGWSSPVASSVLVGRSSDDLPLRATIELVGPVVDLAVRRHFLTRTAVR